MSGSKTRKIIVVGAAGYIGSRLMTRFKKEKIDWVQGYDLGIFGSMSIPEDVMIRDIEDVSGTDLKDSVVIYLASFHREPDNTKHIEVWREAYDHLMRELPVQLAGMCHHLIYVSSMRALTDRSSLYGEVKARAERDLIAKHNVSQLRFGTVWGDFSRAWANRPNTAINYAITRRSFTGDHWEAFTTEMDLALGAIMHRAICISKAEGSLAGTFGGVIENVTDTDVPLCADEVRDLLAGRHPNKNLQLRFKAARKQMPIFSKAALQQDVNAAEKLYTYYGLRAEC